MDAIFNLQSCKLFVPPFSGIHKSILSFNAGASPLTKTNQAIATTNPGRSQI
jgi:hypothetical protein